MSMFPMYPSPQSHPEFPRTPQVLVVDDQPVARAILVSLLKAAGYTVQTADDGAQALAKMQASPDPLLVTLDLVMPHVSGLAMLEVVAADRNLARRHAIVVVTGAGKLVRDARVTALRKQLGIPLLEKPFDTSQLLEVLALAARGLPSWHEAPSTLSHPDTNEAPRNPGL